MRIGHLNMFSVSRYINPVLRVVFGLVALTVSIIMLGAFFGILPDRSGEIARGRQQYCESLAMTFSLLANKADADTIQQHFQSIKDRNSDIDTIGLRTSEGEPLLEIGSHFDRWTLTKDSRSTDSEISIPIFGDSTLWGNLEIRFKAPGNAVTQWFARHPEFLLSGFVTLLGFVVFYLYLTFVLRQLNPAKVLPGRVREALDTLAEGLLVLDKNERIVLANRAFQTATGTTLNDLIGRQAKSLPFINRDGEDKTATPWKQTLESGEKIRGQILNLRDADTTYSVSCAPILDDEGNSRGVLASFEDVTQLENKTNELKEMVFQLDASTKEITRQNKELERLATTDPLTGCNNRRSFLHQFDTLWNASTRYDQPLSAFMVDIDHFKSVNDNHGHAVGDQVLQQVGATLREASREADVVCRFGGEEFAVLLPNTSIDDGKKVAEKIRQAIAALEFEQLSITASIGVSAICQSPENPQELLEQADKCLYVAKKNGRNRVIRWDEVPEDLEVDEASVSRTKEVETPLNRIPFHAITALISALAYRDQETASHCRRVADMSVAVAEGLLPLRDCYTLEIAALLHDIGKIGVPDAILLKPDALTDEEWTIMKQHERTGIELIRTSFACEELDEIVEYFRYPYKQGGTKLPLGARILSIVDAYDSMTSNKSYRKGMSRKEAEVELRRCAGEQFDPELVERVVSTLQVRSDLFEQDPEIISKEAALDIGMQIERLSAALDKRDVEGIIAIAARLKSTAEKHGAEQIAEKAHFISIATNQDSELYEVLKNTNELLDLCRLSQRSLLVMPTPASAVCPVN